LLATITNNFEIDFDKSILSMIIEVSESCGIALGETKLPISTTSNPTSTTVCK